MSATRVLVVDDEPVLAEIVRGDLAAEGMEVAVVRDGPTAVSVVREGQPVDGAGLHEALRSFQAPRADKSRTRVVRRDRRAPGLSGVCNYPHVPLTHV